MTESLSQKNFNYEIYFQDEVGVSEKKLPLKWLGMQSVRQIFLVLDFNDNQLET